jgi:hypothetical protein
MYLFFALTIQNESSQKLFKSLQSSRKSTLAQQKGRQWTDTVRQIYLDFTTAVWSNSRPLPFDILDITIAQFDDVFYRFRSQIKGEFFLSFVEKKKITRKIVYFLLLQIIDSIAFCFSLRSLTLLIKCCSFKKKRI